MSELELQELVEKIVQGVLQRIKVDRELSQLIKSDSSAPKDSWVRTCSSYRDNIANTEQPILTPDIAPALTKKLYTEKDILELAKRGEKRLLISKKSIVTPAAQDAAQRKGIEFVIE